MVGCVSGEMIRVLQRTGNAVAKYGDVNRIHIHECYIHMYNILEKTVEPQY